MVDQLMPRIPADLKAHPCIVYTEFRTRNLWEFNMPDGSIASVRVEGAVLTNSEEILRAAVVDGLGIAYAPSWLFQDLIASGDVQVLLPGLAPRALPINLVSPPERRRAAKVRAFSDHLAAALADDPACR